MMKKPGRLRAAALKWLGVPIHLTDSDFWAEFFGSSSAAGVPVNHQTVLKLSAVWSCVRLISETISTLPLSMYERRVAVREWRASIRCSSSFTISQMQTRPQLYIGRRAWRQCCFAVTRAAKS